MDMIYSYSMPNNHHHRQFLLIVITRHRVSITNTLSQPLNNRYLLSMKSLYAIISVLCMCVYKYFSIHLLIYLVYFFLLLISAVVVAPHKWQVFNVGIHEWGKKLNFSSSYDFRINIVFPSIQTSQATPYGCVFLVYIYVNCGRHTS